MSHISICIIFFFFFFVGSQWVEAQTNPTLTQLLENDMAAVRYAFAFEEEGLALYEYGMANYGSELFHSANVSFALFQTLENQTKAHVSVLRNFYENTFGAQLTSNCTALYAASSFLEYVVQIASHETNAAAVYYGLIPTVYTRSLLSTLASIGEVKSKHSAYLKNALTQSPFPSSFEAVPNPLPSLVFSPSCPPVPPPAVLTAVPPHSAQEVPSRSPILSKRAFSSPDPNADAINPSLAALDDNDLKSLNLALALNDLEVALLNHALARFTANDFTAAGYSSSDYANLLLLLASQLLVQNKLLQDTVTVLNATAYAPCSYSFSQLTTVAQFTSTASSTFDQSTGIFNGILLRLYNKVLLSLVASVAGQNSRYAAFFSNLATGSPFPSDLTANLQPSAAQQLLDEFASICVNPLPNPLLFVIIPADTTSTPTPFPSTSGTCLVTDFRFDASSWSTTPPLNFTVQNASLVVSRAPSDFFFVAPTRYRGNLSKFFAGGNGTVSVVYGSALTGDGSSGLVIRGGNGYELEYPFTTTSSLFVASFGSGTWLVRPQGSNVTATPASSADILGVLTYVQCFLVKGSSTIKGFNLCDTDPTQGSDCLNRCSNHGMCTPNYPMGATCSCNYGYTGADCSTRVRSQTGRFQLPAKVISWNYGL